MTCSASTALNLSTAETARHLTGSPGQNDSSSDRTPELDPGCQEHSFDGPGQPWVAADPFRALLRHLLDASQLPVHHLAAKLGVPLPLCLRLLADPQYGPYPHRRGRPIHRIPADLAEQLVRCDAISLCAELEVTLSAHRARSAVRSLLAAGHRLSTLHRVTGLSLELLDGLAAGTIPNCSGRVDTALQAAKVWAETHLATDTTPGPVRSLAA